MHLNQTTSSQFAPTAAEAQISSELWPTISWQSSSLSICGPCVCYSTFQRQFTAEN